MKITFIVPAIGKKPGQKYIGTWKMEPLTYAVLNSLTPKDCEVELFDDRIELIDYNTSTDAVVISVETYTAKRSYLIAEKFRARHIPVFLGGYHVTLCPEEAVHHCDSIVVGNAECVWAQVLEDLAHGDLKKRYQGGLGYTQMQPDRGLYAHKKYLPISLVETGRGCCHTCDFCAISSYYHKYVNRDIQHIVADIQRSPHRYHFLVDDNLMADISHAKALFRAMEPLKIKWAGQGTLTMARDPKLLKLMKKSGCELILIGFESLEAPNLKQMNKSFNVALGERDELVQRIHDAGIGIYATFVFGYDNDTPATIDQTVAFAKKHRFYTAAFNHLLPFPGTPLYQRLQNQDRLLYDKWWLAEDYQYGQLSFKPKCMTPEEVSQLCRQARKEFASLPSVLKRGMHSMQRSNPLMWGLFWAMNIRLGEEVDKKMNVPIGRNLDDLPK